MTLKFKTEEGNVLEFEVYQREKLGWFIASFVGNFSCKNLESYSTKKLAIADLKATVKLLNMKGTWLE